MDGGPAVPRPRGALLAGLGILALLCAGILALYLDASGADLRHPIEYRGDTLQNARMVKSVVEAGTPWETPDLGAPFGADHYDFPFFAPLDEAVVRLLALATGDVFLILNLVYLAGFVLAAWTCYAVLLDMGCRPVPAGAAALLFAFLPYHLDRYRHVFLSSYFLVPVLAWLAWRVLTGASRPRDGLPAFFAGLCGVYYAALGSLLILGAGLLGAVSQKTWRPLAMSLALAGLCLGAVALTLLPTLVRGPLNPETSRRSPENLAVYSLRLDALALPDRPRRSHPLQAVADGYFSRYGYPGEGQYLGLVAALGLPFLLLRLARGPDPLALLAFLALLLGVTGGLAPLLSAVGGTNIRAYNRLSIFLAFLSLAGLAQALSLLEARIPRARLPVAALLLAGVVALGLLEQRRAVDTWQPAAARREVEAERALVRDVEGLVPPDSMIWQLPYTPYPEEPPFHGEGPYALARGWLHSHGLRWSWGAMRGTPDERLLRAASRLPPEHLVPLLRDSGFAGVYVERRAFADHGAALEGSLGLGPPAAVSPDGHLAFFRLPPGEARADPSTTLEREVRRQALAPGRPLEFTDRGFGYLYTGDGWSQPEAEGTWTQAPTARIDLLLPGWPAGDLDLSLDLSPYLCPGLDRQGLALSAAGTPLGSWTFTEGGRTTVTVRVPRPLAFPGGRLPLDLAVAVPCAPASVPGGKDIRPLGVMLHRLTLTRP